MDVLFVCLLLMNYYYVFFLFFFFQAEDGIRDVAVTGVQTYALPISRSGGGSTVTPAGCMERRPLGCRGCRWPKGHRSTISEESHDPVQRLLALQVPRSEERRVGKSVDLGGRRSSKKKKKEKKTRRKI